MSESGNVDTAGEVDIFVAVDVAQDAAVTAFKSDREESDLTGKTAVVFGGAVVQRGGSFREIQDVLFP